MVLLHECIQAIEIGKTGNVALNTGHVLLDLPDRGIQFALTTSGDIHMRPFCGEAVGRGKTNASASASNDGDFSCKLGHECFSSQEMERLVSTGSGARETRVTMFKRSSPFFFLLSSG